MALKPIYEVTHSKYFYNCVWFACKRTEYKLQYESSDFRSSHQLSQPVAYPEIFFRGEVGGANHPNPWLRQWLQP